MTLVNPHSYSLLLAATNAGCVHLLRDYATPGRTKPVSGFRVVQSDSLWKQWPCIVDWNQMSGLLYVSSQSNVVTVWDLSLERCARDLRLPADVNVSALSSDKASGDLIILGTHDGVLHAHDVRIPEASMPLQSVREYSTPIIKVHSQAAAHPYPYPLVDGYPYP